ncbi:MAG TPA: hypothetical protein PLP33_07235 [Leptospiraceae bacterium]|nr:hypothetical protein [Leptospiraceae bacterium]
MNMFKVAKANRNISENFTGVAEYSNGNKHWYKEGRLHREDGPAVEWIIGYKEWWVEGLRHRTDGPAVEYPNGDKFWYVENIWYPIHKLQSLIRTSIYLGKKQNGKHNLDWLRFLTDKGIKEFPIIPGMEEDNNFIPLINQLFGATIK